MQGELDLRVEDGSLLLASSGGVQGRHVCALHSHTAPLAVGCLGWGGSALCRLLCAFNLCVGGCEWWEGRE